MIASILIICASAVLFTYWFRYTCLLILNTRKARNYERHVADANGLAFVELRARVSETESNGLNPIFESLDKDYRVVTYLLRHTTIYTSAASFDQWLLRLDYNVMSLWYRVVRIFSEKMARAALLEMASVISHFANTMGERSAIASRA